MKIVIAMPVLDKVDAETVLSLLQLIAHSKHQIHFIPCIGNSIIHDARNFLVKQAYTVDFDAILFVDADMVFPADTLNKLAEHDKDICGVLYSSRVEEGTLNAFTFRPKKNTYVRAKVMPDTGLQEVDAIGTGILLVKREVFDKVREPWFFYDAHFSEDINFCHRARQLDYKIHCDTNLDILHVGKMKFSIRRNK